MIIRDKQDLRKCVKQCVRRAQVIETCAFPLMLQEKYGVEANLGDCVQDAETIQESFEQGCSGSPFSEQYADLFAALNALQLPVHDLDKAECIIGGYDRCSYMSAVLDAMRARKVFVHVNSGDFESPEYPDVRFAPTVMVDDSMFVPGRYGVDYEEAARHIAQQIRELGANDVSMMRFDESAIKYCLVPVCEDEHVVMHVQLTSQEELDALLGILSAHGDVHAIVSAVQGLERKLVDEAMNRRNMLVQLRNLENIPYALRKLGTRFIPYSSGARLPEKMLGGWVNAKEALWQALYDAYLPLARAGYELTRERIEADVELLLCGNYEKIHEY